MRTASFYSFLQMTSPLAATLDYMATSSGPVTNCSGDPRSSDADKEWLMSSEFHLNPWGANCLDLPSITH